MILSTDAFRRWPAVPGQEASCGSRPGGCPYLVKTESGSLCSLTVGFWSLAAGCWFLEGPSGGSWVSGRTLGSSLGALLGSPCLAACVAKPTWEVGEPGLFRLLPATVLWVLWARCWRRLGALLWVPGDLLWYSAAPAGLSVGSVGVFWSPACRSGGLSA